MTLAALSSAVTISLASTTLLLLIVKSWDAFSALAVETSQFPHSIMLDAAQRYRDEMDGLGREQSHYLVAVVVFAIVFTIAYLLPRQTMLEDIPRWQQYLTLGLFATASLCTTYRLLQIVVAKRRVAFVRDANIATGHSLQQLTSNHNRVFHDVPCGTQIIDNVIVGLQGVYAVSVIARKHGKDNRVRLRGSELSFAPGKECISVSQSGDKSARLAKELGELLQHEVRVRSVIVVPGWEIESQTSDDYLLVNERNVSMIGGWKDQSDFLMTEDAAKIQKMLVKRCSRYR